MTKQEAIEALKQGNKLRHRYFDRHEWICQQGNYMVMEDGAKILASIFWEDRNMSAFENDWELLNSEQTPERSATTEAQ